MDFEFLFPPLRKFFASARSGGEGSGKNRFRTLYAYARRGWVWKFPILLIFPLPHVGGGEGGHRFSDLNLMYLGRRLHVTFL